MSEERKFWERKSLEQLSPSEWELLCDGCARCCLYKLSDTDTGEVEYTNIACKLLDLDRCLCTDYSNREARMPTCVKVTPELVHSVNWLPATCSYRLIAEGKPLFWWHPLVCGNKIMIHRVGISIKAIAEHETDELMDELEDHVMDIPLMKSVTDE
jgi:hypothetical protein